MGQLQNIQNAAAWVLTKTRQRAYITPVLKSLTGCLSFRISFKMILLVFKSIYDCAPQYMSDITFTLHLSHLADALIQSDLQIGAFTL
jgi:hypothetical protein